MTAHAVDAHLFLNPGSLVDESDDFDRTDLNTFLTSRAFVFNNLGCQNELFLDYGIECLGKLPPEKAYGHSRVLEFGKPQGPGIFSQDVYRFKIAVTQLSFVRDKGSVNI